MTTRGQFNTKSPTIRRILREASELSTTPLPGIQALPLESNLFEWHFTLRGPPSTPYSSGIYHGIILLPPQYPLRPPSFRFLTPSGRFEVNREICLSISGHHEETWQPAWGVRTALVALRGFMEGGSAGQIGGMEASEGVRGRLARESVKWVCGGCGGGRTNEEVMREWEGRWEGKEGEGVGEVEKVPEELRLGYRDELGAGKKEEAAGAASSVPSTPNIDTPASSEGSCTPALVPTPTPTIRQPIQQPPRPVQQQQPAQPAQPAQPHPRLHPVVQVQTNNAEPVPAWIDSAIYTVAFFLVVMIVRRYISLELEDY